MSEVPAELLYSKSHEWVRRDREDIVTVGITDHAQQLLGDIVFVEIPELNTFASAGEDVAVVESVKAASDIYAPIDGEIIAVNKTLEDKPSIINQDPYNEGWIYKIKFKEPEQLEELQDAELYQQQISEE